MEKACISRFKLPLPTLITMVISTGLVRPPPPRVLQPYTTLGQTTHLACGPVSINLDIEWEKNGALVILICIWSQVPSEWIWIVTYDPGPFIHTELIGITIRVLAAVIERTSEGNTPLFSLLVTLKFEWKGVAPS